jgi:YHS domain-containing protein
MLMRFHKKVSALLSGAAACLLVAGAAWAADAPKAEAPKGDPYPLKTCPVSGKELDKNAVTKTIDGREIKFCCENCPAKFEADKATYMKKVDDAIVAQEKPTYAVSTCPVSGKEIPKDGGVDKVIGNRLVRFCCENCPAKYEADPAKYEAKLNSDIINAQKASYPLTTCVVSGEKLGEMGEPRDVVVENRLVRLCCGGCEKKLRANPSMYLSKIDEAAKAAPSPAK